MEERHSSRLFKKKEIPKNILKEMIKVEEMAPSWVNSHSPEMVYITLKKG